MILNKLSLFGFLLLSTASIAQTNLYVAPTGDDNTGNGSIGSPYATIAKAATIANNSTNALVPVTIWMRGGTYHGTGFTTTSILPIPDPFVVNTDDAIWKPTSTTPEVVRLTNITRTAATILTIKAYTGETPILEGDGDNTFNIRNCAYIKIEGLEIRGVLDKIPKQLAWLYWGTYRYASGGSTVYGDRKTDICNTYGISPCTDIPPNVFSASHTDFPTYRNLPNIQSLNVERPNIFGGKGLLVQLSNNIEITGCNIHHFPGGGLRATQSDYVTFKNNLVHHNTSRSSVGTHGLVVEGLTDDSGDPATGVKMTISGNTVYSNYNEIYSWVQTKVICTTEIDEGKGICLLRTSPNLTPPSGFSGVIRVENNLSYDNGKSGIHMNDIDRAEIFNNTVYNNAHSNLNDAAITSTGTNAGISVQSSTNIVINNNIVVVPTGVSPALVALAKCQTGCEMATLSNNLIYGGSNEFGTGSTTADPLFTNMAGNNVTLQAASPAINQGTSVTGQFAITDFRGATRDGMPDIGAYEYGAILPVRLLRFVGAATAKGNLLTWATAEELRFKGFDLEKSINGVDFKPIGKVAARGANSNYEFLDDATGLNYYRLRINDLDGKFEYSKVVSIQSGGFSTVQIKPTFVTDILTVDGATDYQIFNAAGQFVLQSVDNQLNVNHLPQGIYFLRAHDVHGVMVSKKFVKQ